MDVFNKDPTSQLAFSMHENKGVYALLLGSGMSSAAGIPTGWEITQDLIRRLAALEGITDQSDWATWYAERSGDDPDYSELVSSLANTPAERRAVLHRYIEPGDDEQEQGLKSPTDAHKAIAALVRSGHIKVIITTNFDRLIENALREEGIEPTVVSSPDMLAGAEPLTHSQCFILKLHGDYKDARILNTAEELGAYPDGYNQLLDRIFDEFGLIVAGWSGQWDDALRTAILRAANRRYPTFWATRGKFSDYASDLIRARDAVSIEIDSGDQFFSSLKERIDTLERSRRANPQSLELLLKTAKRYIARPEHRIELSDLVEDQLQQLTERLDTDELAANGSWSVEEFQARIQLYEQLAEPLVRLTGLLGRYGDGSEVSLVLNCLSVQTAHANSPNGGLSVWLDIRSYPLVLIYTAYGLALTETQRFDALRDLFDYRVFDRHGEPQRIVEAFHLWAWPGANKEVWQSLEGLDRRHTPVSDHLCEIMDNWRKDITGPVAQFETSYETFEILGSLAHFDQHELADMQSRFRDGDANDYDSWIWMPIGRSGWNFRMRERIFTDLESSSIQEQLFAAKFSKGSPEVFEYFKINFGLMSRGLR